MARISEKVETSIQKELPRSASAMIDDAVLYLNIHFFRYLEGGRHITGDCHFEFVGKPDLWYPLPGIARELFARKRFVLELESPVCWDNENDPIPEQDLQKIISCIDHGLHRKYKRYKIKIGGREIAVHAKEPAVTN
jgi:hypothetical protein